MHFCFFASFLCSICYLPLRLPAEICIYHITCTVYRISCVCSGFFIHSNGQEESDEEDVAVW